MASRRRCCAWILADRDSRGRYTEGSSAGGGLGPVSPHPVAGRGSAWLMSVLLPSRGGEGLSQDATQGLDHLPLPIGGQVIPGQFVDEYPGLGGQVRGGPR